MISSFHIKRKRKCRDRFFKYESWQYRSDKVCTAFDYLINGQADDDILEELKHCFAHYDKDDIRKALMATHKLFDRIAKAVAEILGYNYPLEVEKCADRYIQIKSD